MGLLRSLSGLIKGVGTRFTNLTSPRQVGQTEDIIVDMQVCAILGDHKKLKDIIVSSDIDHNILDEKGNTILHLAIKHDNLKTVKVILKHAVNINVNFKNNAGNTPLHLAAMNNDLVTISLLINYHADKYVMNDQGETPYNIRGISDETSLYITGYYPPPVLQVSPRD